MQIDLCWVCAAWPLHGPCLPLAALLAQATPGPTVVAELCVPALTGPFPALAAHRTPSVWPPSPDGPHGSRTRRGPGPTWCWGTGLGGAGGGGWGGDILRLTQLTCSSRRQQPAKPAAARDSSSGDKPFLSGQATSSKVGALTKGAQAGQRVLADLRVAELGAAYHTLVQRHVPVLR